MSTYHVSLSEYGLHHSRWFFILISACKIHDVIVFKSWVILHCVNIPHFLYSFFSWGTTRLLPASIYYEYSCYEHSWTSVVLEWSILWLFVQELYSWILNYIDLQSGYTCLHCYQQWRRITAVTFLFSFSFFFCYQSANSQIMIWKLLSGFESSTQFKLFSFNVN